MTKYFLRHGNPLGRGRHATQIHINEETGIAYLAKLRVSLNEIQTEHLIDANIGKDLIDEENAHQENRSRTIAEFEVFNGLMFEYLLGSEHVSSALPAEVEGQFGIYTALMNYLPFEKCFDEENIQGNESMLALQKLIQTPEFIRFLARVEASNYIDCENDFHPANGGFNPDTGLPVKIDGDQASWPLTAGFSIYNHTESYDYRQLVIDSKLDDSVIKVHFRRGFTPELLIGAQQFEVSSEDIFSLCQLEGASVPRERIKYRPINTLRDWISWLLQTMSHNIVSEQSKAQYTSEAYSTFIEFILEPEPLLRMKAGKSFPIDKTNRDKTIQFYLNRKEEIINEICKIPEFRSFYLNNSARLCEKAKLQAQMFIDKQRWNLTLQDSDYHIPIQNLENVILNSDYDNRALPVVPYVVIPDLSLPNENKEIGEIECKVPEVFNEAYYKQKLKTVLSGLTENSKNLISVLNTVESFLGKFLSEFKGINNVANLPAQNFLLSAAELKVSLANSKDQISDVDSLPSISMHPEQKECPKNPAECLNLMTKIEHNNRLKSRRYVESIKNHPLSFNQLLNVVTQLKDKFSNDYTIKLRDCLGLQSDKLRGDLQIEFNKLYEEVSKIYEPLNGYYANINKTILYNQSLAEAYGKLSRIYLEVAALTKDVETCEPEELLHLRARFEAIQEIVGQRHKSVNPKVYQHIDALCAEQIGLLNQKMQINPALPRLVSSKSLVSGVISPTLVPSMSKIKDISSDRAVIPESLSGIMMLFLRNNWKKILLSSLVGIVIAVSIVIPPVAAAIGISTLMYQLIWGLGWGVGGVVVGLFSGKCGPTNNQVLPVSASVEKEGSLAQQRVNKMQVTTTSGLMKGKFKKPANRVPILARNMSTLEDETSADLISRTQSDSIKDSLSHSTFAPPPDRDVSAQQASKSQDAAAYDADTTKEISEVLGW